MLCVIAFTTSAAFLSLLSTILVHAGVMGYASALRVTLSSGVSVQLGASAIVLM